MTVVIVLTRTTEYLLTLRVPDGKFPQLLYMQALLFHLRGEESKVLWWQGNMLRYLSCDMVD